MSLQHATACNAIHIADRCRGFAILDDITRRYKNVYFYGLNIKPVWEETVPPQLHCLPKSVISTCIRGIVEDHCGTMTADFVQKYLLFTQDWRSQMFQSAGLTSNMCDSDISSDIVLTRPPITSGHTNLGISRLLEITVPGTALDTVLGKNLLGYLHRLSERELCKPFNTYAAYGACWMSSDAKSEKSKFNILQFAHRLVRFRDHGTQCSQLKQFTQCWNLLQEVCGSKIGGLEHHATLLVEGCKIQSELDTARCHWQDMLLRYYIQASRVTVWPMVLWGFNNPMNLDSNHYATLNGIMNDLDTVISLLQPEVEEIARKCGLKPANRLRALFQKLHYLQRDIEKYGILLQANHLSISMFHAQMLQFDSRRK